MVPAVGKDTTCLIVHVAHEGATVSNAAATSATILVRIAKRGRLAEGIGSVNSPGQLLDDKWNVAGEIAIRRRYSYKSGGRVLWNLGRDLST